jgi:hypothetical protein
MTDDEWSKIYNAPHQGGPTKPGGGDVPGYDDPPPSGGSGVMGGIMRGAGRSAADLATGAVDFLDEPTLPGGTQLPTPSHFIKQIPGYSWLKSVSNTPSQGTAESMTREAGDIAGPMLLPIGKVGAVEAGAAKVGNTALRWIADRYGPGAAQAMSKDIGEGIDWISSRFGPDAGHEAATKMAQGAKNAGALNAAAAAPPEASRAGKFAIGAAKGAPSAGVQPTQQGDPGEATAAGGVAGGIGEAFVPPKWRWGFGLAPLAIIAAQHLARGRGEISPFMAYEAGQAAPAALGALGPSALGGLAGQAVNQFGGQ